MAGKPVQLRESQAMSGRLTNKEGIMRQSSTRRLLAWAGIEVLALALLAAGSAPAFVLNQVYGQTSRKWYPTRWPNGLRRLPFVLNNQPLELLSNLAENSDPVAAVQAAMQAWALVPPVLSLQGQVPDTDVGQDGQNLITLADTPANRDAVADHLALTLRWYGNHPSNLTYFPIIEADIVVNSQDPWATDGRSNRYDLQHVVTHELGHVLGLSHSPVMAVTMNPFSGLGQTEGRVPDLDDLAGIRTLYHLTADVETGQISGKVLTTDDAPVFGAHVVAVDSDGIVCVGALTEPDGSFTLPFLPPGEYKVYAEPVQGVTTLTSYPSRYQTASTDFRTAFAGADRAGSPVLVAPGETTPLDPIRVDNQPASLVPLQLGWSPDGRRFTATDRTLLAKPGDRRWLVLVGSDLDAVTDVRASGPDFSLDMSQSVGGMTDQGPLYLMVPLSVHSAARPGPRSLIVDTGDELALFTGGLRVVAP
jgi:hypothetical protein